MIVDIEKIVIRDRIRKDFGDIQELADDIKQNGLINPPVVNKEYELLAGERRLRACKSLGWKQVEIRMMDTRDAEHELNVEISENDVRKGFTKSERVDYMKRLLRIEQAKAKERQGERTSVENKTDVVRADTETAKQFGIAKDTMRKEMSIVDHKDLLAPADFANWDEGKLSTNKAFQKIKAELAKKEQRIAELEEAKNKPDMKDKFYTSRIKDLSDKNEDLKRKIVDLERSEYELKQQIDEMEDSQPEPEIREVEVVPDDYEDLKNRNASFTKENKMLLDGKRKQDAEIKQLRERLADLETRQGVTELQKKLEEEAGHFAIRTYDYIQKNGGYVWVTERMKDLQGDSRKQFINAVYAIDAFAKQMIENIGGYGIE